MKNIRLTQGFAIVLFLFLTACMPEQYTTYIVGKWQPVKLKTPDNMQVTVPDRRVQQVSPENRQELDQLRQALAEQGKKGMRLEELQSQVRRTFKECATTYSFTAEGTGIRETPGGESMEGTWRLKNRGKLLLLTNADSAQPFKLRIDT
ncbi:MAG: hypothetical protein D4R67_03560, partial [Bacteroidetes bacterium]